MSAEIAALKAQRDELLTALKGGVELAAKGFKHWDADDDMKAGKILLALAGRIQGYDRRATAIHKAIAKAQP